jgi:subfamily B ATP-binding cassette protein MsbA
VTISRRVRKWSKRSLENTSVITSKIHEILTCVKVVKAYNTENHELDKYRGVNKSLLKTTLRAVRLALLVGPAVETVGIILICAFVVWCFIADVTLSNVVPMLAPLLLIYKPLKQLAKLQSQVEQGRAALGRIFSILDVAMDLPERKDPVLKKSFDSGIRFENVSFRYDTAERDAVKSATFEIPRGSFVAVVGATGSGKSTLSGLLSRFYDPREGRVLMDGVDLRDIANSDLRNLIGSVMQETLLFNDTIEANIKYGSPDATFEEIVKAAKLANAHEFIMSQPEGYSRVVGEKGFALSGGER